MQLNETRRLGKQDTGGACAMALFGRCRAGLAGLGGLLVAILLCGGAVQAQQEKRFGLVIGNSEYPNGPVPTSANDAGLIAQTLQASGFDVMGARDLDGDALRNTFRDFVDKVAAEGPGAVAFIYLAGHGVQYEGENYFVPVDARIDRDVDVPLRALRLNDYVRPLGALKAKAVIVVLDAAREAPFARSGQPLAGGLALVEPAPGMLWAFNAAPGTISPMGELPYGSYAQALAEMMREGGLSLDGVFERTRLRVHEATAGGEVPWHASQVRAPFVFFERAADAPAEISLSSAQSRRERPIRAFDDAREAYLAALERDSLDGYMDFLRAYPDHALAKRVRAIVAARREAITWRRARNSDRPEAYWSYLDRYPNGPHAPDARRRLAFLTAPIEPPPRYVAFDYDVPPPPPDEIIYVRRPYVYFADPDFGFVAPPPPPLFFLPPRPRFFRPPPPPVGVFLLPVPMFVPVPAYVRPPVYVAPPPPNNVVFRNLHNAPPPQAPAGAAPGTPVAPVAPGTGGPSAGTIAAGVAAGALIGAAAATVALPPSVQRRPGVLPPGTGVAPGTVRPPVVSKTGIPATPGAVLPATGGAGPLGKGPASLTTAPVPGAPGAPGVKSPALPPSNALPGAPTGAPLPKSATGTPSGAPVGTTTRLPPGAPLPKAATGTPSGAPVGTTTGLPPGAPLPKSATGTPSGAPLGTTTRLPPGAPLPKAATGTPSGAPVGTTTGLPPGAPLPKSATGTPPPTPQVKAPVQTPIPAAPVSKAPSPPQIDPRVRAQQDRAAAEAKLLQDRQRDLDRRRQEQEAQQKARQQNQLQDLQKQRQQQMDAQRKAMEQQRQQQQAQQAQQAAAARAQAEAQARARAAQQQAQQAQQAAAARAQAEARARAAQQQQQQAAQAAAARAQAEAQARAKAAQQQKKCGGPGLPPCPK